jgi:hypothetical protein
MPRSTSRAIQTGTISSTALFEDLKINVAPKAVLTNHGVISTAGPEFGGRVDILGGKGSQLVNDGVIDPTHGYVAKADVDVSGTGAYGRYPMADRRGMAELRRMVLFLNSADRLVRFKASSSPAPRRRSHRRRCCWTSRDNSTRTCMASAPGVPRILN